MTDEAKAIAEIEARQIIRSRWRDSPSLLAPEASDDCATLLAIVREAYEVADVREGDTLAGKIQEYLSDRDFLARQNQTLKKRAEGCEDEDPPCAEDRARRASAAVGAER